MMYELLDSYQDTFGIMNMTNGTGNCGDDPFYSSVYAFTDYYFYGMDETLNATVSTYCGLVNESLMVTGKFSTQTQTHLWILKPHMG